MRQGDSHVRVRGVSRSRAALTAQIKSVVTEACAWRDIIAADMFNF